MGLFRSAATISSLTMVSRVTGLMRDTLIARTFGAGALTDAFWIAFRIPNFLRRLFAEGAFSQAFVPILGAARAQSSDAQVRTLLDRVALLLTVVLMLVTVVGVLIAPWLVLAMASGLRGAAYADHFEAAVWMTRVMFPYIFCMSLVAFASGVLNTWKKFAVPAFTPVLLNLAMIAASVLFSAYLETPIYALAIGVMVGGILQLAWQWIALVRLGLLPRLWRTRLRDAWCDSTVRHILRQMLPATLGVSVAQISLLVNTNIASWLASGSVTWLSFADRLFELPVALLGVTLGTVLLPTLSAAYARGQKHDYSALLDWGLRLVLLLGLPAALGLVLLSEGLVATLFHYGAFTATDVLQTRYAVMGYGAGLIGVLMVKILAPSFYAQKNIRTPVKVAVLCLIVTQMLNVLMVPRFAHAGLALSITGGTCLNAGLLWMILRRYHGYRPSFGWWRFLFKIFVALLVLGLAIEVLNAPVDWIALRATPWLRVALLGGIVILGALVYFGLLVVLGFRARDFARTAI